MNTVSYLVCAHKSRSSWAWTLAERLEALVVFDDGTYGSLANHDRAWELGSNSNKGWVCVLEDDSVLCDGFTDQVQAAIQHRPYGDTAISLYTGTSKPMQRDVMAAIRRASHTDASWLISDSAYWGVGLLLPRRLVSPMLSYVRGRVEPYDERMSYFLRDQKIPCLYTNPSLIDHKDGKSLIKGTITPRRAHRFGNRSSWNDTYIPIGRFYP